MLRWLKGYDKKVGFAQSFTREHLSKSGFIGTTFSFSFLGVWGVDGSLYSSLGCDSHYKTETCTNAG